MAADPGSSWHERLRPILYLSNNWISRLGVIFVTAAGVIWLFLLPTYLHGQASSAYLGILLFLLLPVVFFGGLALIPLGIFIRRKRHPFQAGGQSGLPVLSWSNVDFRRLVVFVGGVTAVNVLIGGNLSYRAVHHMDSVQFCGATCHVVMKPEYVAYQHSPHSRVECVKCHIGPGASWFVRSKLSGVHQVFAVLLNTYSRPIPTPVANLRPARETCEACHWPDKYGPDRLIVRTHFADDNSMTKSVLLMKIGGGGVAGKGIHSAHVGQGIEVRYAHTDYARQNIPWIEYRRNGEVREYFAPNTNPAEVAKMNLRLMDCVDCHTRPSHSFTSPERGVDKALASGEIPLSLKQIRKHAVEILKRPYASGEQAAREIPAAVAALYPHQAEEAKKAGQALLALWSRNVFPEMKVTWGTYIDNIGHIDFPGCFRCHDDAHKSKDGRTVSQDCNSCHTLLAMEERDPKILKDLGFE
ncbi:MAG: NapC/NirT family cytochrome c [Bryobacteraceae bacterium]|nr:NapC/NirT family cytochrome c [Bryobacteraceae bacterium]MDW8377620.1 NapC/NirT family cytochrome c [Bryobacterales bacterium]